jgi:hypothetical protein
VRLCGQHRTLLGWGMRKSKGLTKKSLFWLLEPQKTLEKRLCGGPLEQPTHPTMEGFAALMATLHVCRSRTGGRAMEGPKFSKMLHGLFLRGESPISRPGHSPPPPPPLYTQTHRWHPAQKTRKLDHIHVYDTQRSTPLVHEANIAPF